MTSTSHPASAPATPGAAAARVADDVLAAPGPAADAILDGILAAFDPATAAAILADARATLDADPSPDAVLAAVLDDFARAASDTAAARRADYAERNPREYATERRAAALDALDEAIDLDPDDDTGMVAPAAARHRLEHLRSTVHLRGRNRGLLTRLSATAARGRDEYATRAAGGPSTWRTLAAEYAAVVALLRALLVFLRATVAPADTGTDTAPATGPAPARSAAADPPPPAGYLLAVTLTAAPAAPPRTFAAACA